MNPEHKDLLIKPRASDYVFGSNSPIVFKSVLSSGDWLPYIEFFERQLIGGGDSNGCVLFSTQEAFDAQIEFMIQNNQISTELLTFFNANGYMDTNSADGKAHFHTSPRFLQILTGNGFNGNSVPEAADVIRTYGCLPYTDLPVEGTTMETYLTGLTQEMKDKALRFLTALGGKQSVQYHWIVNAGATNLPAMTQALQQSPLLLGIDPGTEWNQVQPYPPAVGSPVGHCVMNYLTNTAAWIYDHYTPNPKELVDYPIPYVLQMIVSLPAVIEQQIVNTVSDIIPQIATAPIPNTAKETLLSEIVIALEKFLSSL